mgnify:CR=1 FL=1
MISELIINLKDLISSAPEFLLGAAVIGVLLVISLIKHPTLPKLRTIIASALLYFYACYMFDNIVGIPTLSEWRRMRSEGLSIFHPSFNFKLLAYGFNYDIVLNVLLFVPIGFLAAWASRHYESLLRSFIFGLGVSAVIELSQMFTALRATDIDDLITNTIGAVLGYLIFRLLLIIIGKKHKKEKRQRHGFIYGALPPIICAVAFICTFLAGYVRLP